MESIGFTTKKLPTVCTKVLASIVSRSSHLSREIKAGRDRKACTYKGLVYLQILPLSACEKYVNVKLHYRSSSCTFCPPPPPPPPPKPSQTMVESLLSVATPEKVGLSLEDSEGRLKVLLASAHVGSLRGRAQALLATLRQLGELISLIASCQAKVRGSSRYGWHIVCVRIASTAHMRTHKRSWDCKAENVLRTLCGFICIMFEPQRKCVCVGGGRGGGGGGIP